MAGRLSSMFRTALVTGASSGLGAAFVEMLASEGVEVWGTSRSRDRVPDRDRFHGLELDLAEDASIHRAWRTAGRESGGIDLLVNNAGAAVFGFASGLPAEIVNRQLDTLLRAPAVLALAAFEAMRSRGSGCIVNVTSLAVEFPIPGLAAYSAAKAGLASFTAGLAQEGAASGVRVIDFRPGDYRTSFNAAMQPTAPSVAEERVWRRLEAITATAPPPSRAARDLRRALLHRRHGMVRSGSFFQARLAPFLQRFASQRVSRWVQGRYFGLR